MKLGELFDRAIAAGRARDPRGEELVLRDLGRRKKDYDALKDDEKEFFDAEALSNPYADSRILHGTGNEEVTSILLGIDMEVGEVLLARAMNQAGTRVDAVVAHHPEGVAYAKLWDVMAMQADILGKYGVQMGAAEGLMEKRIADVERKLLPVNHTRAVDAARLMGMPMLNLHTPADNMVASYLQDRFDAEQPYTLGDIMDMLMGIPEYRDARKQGAGPKIFLGSPSRRAGKVFVDMTGGTEGHKEIFAGMAAAGINTVVGMHYSEDHRAEAEKHHMNMLIAGHISSDNLGLNLLLDAIDPEGALTVHACSGFRRFERG
jgi:hypothetical protein